MRNPICFQQSICFALGMVESLCIFSDNIPKSSADYSLWFEEQIEEVNRNIPSIIAQEIKSNGKLIA